MAKRSKRRDPDKERFWRSAMRRWQRSGQTIAAFCREADLSVAGFHWWRRELNRRDRTDANTGRRQHPRSAVPFVPVQLTSPASAFSGQSVIEIAFPHGAVVRVDSDVNRDALATVMAVLEDSAC
jgi:hypothetical protein